MDSDSEDELMLLTTMIVVSKKRTRREAEQRKRLLVRPWLTRRSEYGAYDRLMNELRDEDISGYKSFQRLHPDLFEELLFKVHPLICKQDTNMRMAIPSGVRLAITLRYLATGHTYLNQSFEFRVASNTIGKIVPETCDAIYQVLKDDYFKFPQTENEWLDIADEFYRKWNFPNCLGSLDGKHVQIRPPPNSGSVFFNYKHTFSLVLLALVDANYRFIFVDAGINGRVSDGGVFAATKLYKALEDNTLDLPNHHPFPNDDQQMPFTILGDDAFALRSYLMKPYAQRNLTQEKRIFNYRLSRGRRVVENAFGILANRFRFLQSPILIRPDRVEKAIMASCALHNMLRARAPATFIALVDQEDPNTHIVQPGSWRSDECLQDVVAMRGNNSTKAAKSQRNYICHYFNNIGKVSWQDRMV